MDTTIVGIGREVRRRIMDEGLSPKEAAEKVARVFVGDADGKLRALLDSGLLGFAFAKAESETLHTDKLYADGGDQRGRGLHVSTEAPVRTRYDAFYASPLDVVVPVANTGVRKALGEFLEADCMAVRNFYRATAETATKAANAFGRAATALKKRGPQATLREVWDELEEGVIKAIQH